MRIWRSEIADFAIFRPQFIRSDFSPVLRKQIKTYAHSRIRRKFPYILVFLKSKLVADNASKTCAEVGNLPKFLGDNFTKIYLSP